MFSSQLFLYEMTENRGGGAGPGGAQPSVVVSHVIDMRDDLFDVKSVQEADVIHANKKDIPCIFSVSSTTILL